MSVQFYNQTGTPVAAQPGDLWHSAGVLKICIETTPVQVFQVIPMSPVVPAITDISAGGTGAAAGGWDTAGHRDAAIVSIQQIITQLRKSGFIA